MIVAFFVGVEVEIDDLLLVFAENTSEVVWQFQLGDLYSGRLTSSKNHPIYFI